MTVRPSTAYTPDTISVREEYVRRYADPKDQERGRAEFDRWIQGVINVAYNDGYSAGRGEVFA